MNSQIFFFLDVYFSHVTRLTDYFELENKGQEFSLSKNLYGFVEVFFVCYGPGVVSGCTKNVKTSIPYIVTHPCFDT